ncbi:NADPH--cytochrome reductase [Paenibacillus sp. BIHB 4019]|uniref:Bifunctional cytochrome P450/NADPH--P450 reductase n=1 Tax=Paenibacillus sp. BIHB 4019 TaxID=1870819 RepID=A0A1B2DDQ0_9BACL|nr:cytochrome P450 [Paenibacillus sp. BIHB 4019]ANY65848.1 NADPH--cytochrome reductase [Paenibacillus sp. BIHB 4019]
MKEKISIPHPPTYGPLGNLPLIDIDSPTLSLGALAEKYGPIFKFTAPGLSSLIVSGHELVAEVCDVTRFDKYVYNELQNVRAFGGDGLFTSWTHEPNWKKAHNILLPTFSKQAMKGYHSMMIDIAEQLILKWARLNPQDSVDVADDMTRLTLDTIGLCGFNYRFNSFYREDHAPFVQSMVRALNEAMLRGSRMKIQNMLMIKTKRRFEEDIQTMFTLVDKIIAERKANSEPGQTDLLARMLEGKDPETGEMLDNENIRHQIITFLIAGHETTSGLLSFAIYFLLKNPEVLLKAQEEVGRVLTSETPQYEEVLQLNYIRLILNESLRLWPTAPGFDVYAREDTVIGGKYPIAKGQSFSVLLPQLHRDPAAWGEDADLFRPERFEDPTKVPHHAYKPFGNGERACIGMQFALYEATLVLGMVLKHFDLIDYDNYTLDVKQTLTLKPGDFQIRVRPRQPISTRGAAAITDAPETNPGDSRSVAADQARPAVIGTPSGNESLLVLYGSNLGTSESIARQIASTATGYGIHSEVAPLNEWSRKLPGEAIAIIVTASYNGKAPYNASAFVDWLKEAGATEGQAVRYAVLGCGDRTWSGTYQSIPRFIDERLDAIGAKRLVSRGEVDAGGDMEQQVKAWLDAMWPTVTEELGIQVNRMEMANPSTLQLHFVEGPSQVPYEKTYQASYATVQNNRELQASESGRSTRHIELLLPEGISYREGDHIGVLPLNRDINVDRILKRFGMDGSEMICLSKGGSQLTHLPLERSVNVRELIKSCVELQASVTRAQLQELAVHTVCPPHRRELEAMMEDERYTQYILGNRVTMLELLEQYEACELPFSRLLELLPPLKPRYYSISSSPLLHPREVSITVGVVKEPAWSGKGEYAGVASTYLADRVPGDRVLMFVQTPESGFGLPEEAAAPIIMIGPGTGVAPFRGFLQARSVLKQQGVALGEAHLFYGCRNEMDFLYRDELVQFEQEGVVKLYTAFSRVPSEPKTYVQDLMKQVSSSLMDLIEQRGKIYVCGDGSQMAPAVEETLKAAYEERHGAAPEAGDRWLEHLEEESRYVKDVWAGNSKPAMS